MTTTTTHYNLIKSQIGGRTDQWGQDIHNSYDIIDAQMKANEDAAAASLKIDLNLSDVGDPAAARSNIGADDAGNLTGTLPTALTENIDTIGALRSSGAAIGSTTNPDKYAVICSSTSKVSDAGGVVIASAGCETFGTQGNNAIIASENSTAGISTFPRGRAAVLASFNSSASNSQSVVMASFSSESAGQDSVVMCGASVLNNSTRSLALGNGSGAASTANRTIHLFGVDGGIVITGQVTTGASFSDFAEMFPNATGAEIPPGTLLALDPSSGGVRPAEDGEEICGVVSHTAAILAGDSSFCWAGRYAHDEWGRPLFEGEGEERGLKQSPLWNPDLPQVPRSERPAEWTTVGLLGRVLVRTGHEVAPGDRIKAVGGKGFRSTERTGVKVLVVKKPFDGKYGIALCLVNVMV